MKERDPQNISELELLLQVRNVVNKMNHTWKDGIYNRIQLLLIKKIEKCVKEEVLKSEVTTAKVTKEPTKIGKNQEVKESVNTHHQEAE